MKKFFALFVFVFPSLLQAQSPTEERLITRWGKNVTPANAWQSYPRPQLQRALWQNLNGLWEYAITDAQAAAPTKGDGSILVPFCVESALSGVQKSLQPNQRLWYFKQVTIPSSWKGKRILLHFEAVDWESTVWVNNQKVSTHQGGSDPFTIDITAMARVGKPNDLKVAVWDPTDTETQPRGKQRLKPGGIWYTPVSGIWQTVWLEAVSQTAIASVRTQADIKKDMLSVHTQLDNPTGKETLEIRISKKGTPVLTQTLDWKPVIELAIPSADHWMPGNPALYDMTLVLKQKGKSIDQIKTYFAMRTIHLGTDAQGHHRIFLNNKPLFLYGTLDQGWWPDGLLTPPSEEAMRWDMEMLQKMGFNMLRKHIKVEPSRYYYYADSLGLVVWQDMVSGFQQSQGTTQHIRPAASTDWQADEKSAVQFKKELKAMIDHLNFFPCIGIWTIHNEGWGQHQTKELVQWAMQYDPTRLIDGVSGWTDRNVSHLFDTHHYPGPGMLPPALAPGRISVLGEFGGLGLPVEGHLWQPKSRNWGYANYKSTDKFMADYTRLIYNLESCIQQGLAAAVYTQTTDVEVEVNGLITYDRDSTKIDPAYLHLIHSRLYQTPLEPVTTLVPDHETQARKMEGSPEFTFPAENHFSGKTGRIQKTFTLTTMPKGLFLRLYTYGLTEVAINGQPVWKDTHKTWRFYDTINLTDHLSALTTGLNEITISVEFNSKNDMIDMGLYSF